MRRTTADPGSHRVRKLAVFTDLDGCLLDARTYGFGPAGPLVRRLRRRGVPLVLCTSKTRAELRVLLAELGARLPAIVEDGGGLVLPPGAATRARIPGARRTRDGRVVPLAMPYRRVRRLFARLRRLTGGAAVGFGDLGVAAVAALTELPTDLARRAKRREFDEPFVFQRDEARYRHLLRRFASAHGVTITRGGRFYHLHGPTDKGRAARLMRSLLEQQHGPLFLVGLGDSPLDAPLLAEAEVPIIVPRPDGGVDRELRRRFPHARIAPAPGPRGWARAVAATLRKRGGL